IHGGYWQWLDKPDFSVVARGLQPEGAAVVVVNYALISAVGMDQLVRQCRASIAWVHRHAASFGGDPIRIYVSGHSAGGHLVAMAMSTDWQAFGGLPTDVIKAGCAISGLYDLEPIRLCYLNAVLKLTPEDARRNSSVHCAPRRSGPLLLPLGGLERRLEDRVYVVYVSPLRALNNDIEKNLRAPLAGIRAAAAAEGIKLPEVRVAVRTGDTLAPQRQAMTRRPPHVLITTPES